MSANPNQARRHVPGCHNGAIRGHTHHRSHLELPAAQPPHPEAA